MPCFLPGYHLGCGIIVVVKVAAILLFLYLGFSRIDPANWNPFLPFGWGGVVTGAAIVFFAYIGFDAVSTTAEEVRNPRRDLPIGLIGSLLIATVLYIAVSLVLTGIVPYPELNVPAPVAFALDQIGIPWGGTLLGITSVLLVLLFGQTRIIFAMSRDGLLPAAFGKVHPTLRTPVNVTLAVGLVTAAIGSLLPSVRSRNW